ncbi:hypothetical protein DFR58_1108 [Anaerobacterium chartisolvens]|uniref:Winged helix-turn-helix protein n=1 Tax=Anaerobacterium chartisolvens TaxID=1297424 RepID=A0A369B5B3_9FIRM|nr:helix-turn-helix domain-containing protein [Anaerobacterium chartisolvens]RCX16515.1 hypothetical protein DFR58_1108 [Anaerobacterium chartisolvens]
MNYKYKKNGIDGLKDKEHKIGSPSNLGDKNHEALRGFMGRSPKELKYLQTCWTIRLMLYRLQNEYNLEPIYTTVKRQLKILGYL